MTERGTYIDKRGSFKHISNVTQRDLDKAADNCTWQAAVGEVMSCFE